MSGTEPVSVAEAFRRQAHRDKVRRLAQAFIDRAEYQQMGKGTKRSRHAIEFFVGAAAIDNSLLGAAFVVSCRGYDEVVHLSKMGDIE